MYFFILVIHSYFKHGAIWQINQLEKDKDVISQSQAIAVLEQLPQLSNSVVNALNTFLNDTKVF
jgi:hypothetical protein